MKRQLIIGFLMLLACLLPCIADIDNSRIAPTQTFDAIEQADLSIDEQAHEVRRMFVKTHAMKKPGVRGQNICGGVACRATIE